jgi:hypothetical protein
VRDRATLYLYQLEKAPQGPESVDPHWRIPARGLEAALQQYLASPDTKQPFDLVSDHEGQAWGRAAGAWPASGERAGEGLVVRLHPPDSIVWSLCMAWVLHLSLLP